MTDEEIERLAIELQKASPQHPRGAVMPWDVLVESSREYWREKMRRGERAH